MRDLVPYIFWPWFGISCFILMRRRVSGGSWKSSPPTPDAGPIEFPPPPPVHAPVGSSLSDGPASETALISEAASVSETASRPAPSVMTAPPGDRPRTLADALTGIVMPCELAPLMGRGVNNPREIDFFTRERGAADVGPALADELERLGYEIHPVDERTIRAERDGTTVQARILSDVTSPGLLLAELHPSAPKDSVVVELKLI